MFDLYVGICETHFKYSKVFFLNVRTNTFWLSKYWVVNVTFAGQAGATPSTGVQIVSMRNPSSRAVCCTINRLTYAPSFSSATTSAWVRFISMIFRFIGDHDAGPDYWTNHPWMPCWSLPWHRSYSGEYNSAHYIDDNLLFTWDFKRHYWLL